MVLLAVLVAVLYGLLALVKPHHRCPRCKGTGIVRQKGKRPRGCPKCKGRRKVQRPGARMVHRFFWSVAGDSLRKGRRKEGSDVQK
jgi:hypothetical protein